MQMYEFRDGETGEHLANVPFEALKACSQPGNVESACAFWVRDTEFVADFPELRAAIQRYGVDASALDDDGVYHYIVFLAAGSDWREALAAEEDEAKQLRTTRSARGNAPVALQARRPQSAPSSLSRRKLIANPAPQRVPVYKIEAWGNLNDGWTVNDRRRAGYLPADDCAQSDDHLLQALQVMNLIGHFGAYRVVDASGDGNVLSVEKRFNGEPVLEIECASAEEVLDSYELNPAPREKIEIHAERHHSGGWSVSAMIDGQLVRELYQGFTKKDAIALFADEHVTKYKQNPGVEYIVTNTSTQKWTDGQHRTCADIREKLPNGGSVLRGRSCIPGRYIDEDALLDKFLAEHKES